MPLNLRVPGPQQPIGNAGEGDGRKEQKKRDLQGKAGGRAVSGERKSAPAEAGRSAGQELRGRGGLGARRRRSEVRRLSDLVRRQAARESREAGTNKDSAGGSRSG